MDIGDNGSDLYEQVQLIGKHPCGLCGRDRTMGSASVTEDDKVIYLCHPDGSTSDCYHLWTVEGYRPIDGKPKAWLQAEGVLAEEPILEEWQADRLLARLGRVRAKIAHFEAQHAEMVGRYDLWLERMTDDLSDQSERIRAQLVEWALSRVAAEPKGPKTFDLPSGTIKTHQPPPAVHIPDEHAFRMWAYRENRWQLLRPPKVSPWTVDKKAIKTALEAGELVEGAELVQGERQVIDIRTEGEPE